MTRKTGPEQTPSEVGKKSSHRRGHPVHKIPRRTQKWGNIQRRSNTNKKQRGWGEKKERISNHEKQTRLTYGDHGCKGVTE